MYGRFLRPPTCWNVKHHQTKHGFSNHARTFIIHLNLEKLIVCPSNLWKNLRIGKQMSEEGGGGATTLEFPKMEWDDWLGTYNEFIKKKCTRKSTWKTLQKFSLCELNKKKENETRIVRKLDKLIIFRRKDEIVLIPKLHSKKLISINFNENNCVSSLTIWISFKIC